MIPWRRRLFCIVIHMVGFGVCDQSMKITAANTLVVYQTWLLIWLSEGWGMNCCEIVQL